MLRVEYLLCTWHALEGVVDARLSTELGNLFEVSSKNVVRV